MIVRWLASARNDVVSIARHIATENPLAATRMAQELLIAGDSLASFPHRGRPGLAAGTRELVAVWPYLIVYRIDAPSERGRRTICPKLHVKEPFTWPLPFDAILKEGYET